MTEHMLPWPKPPELVERQLDLIAAEDDEEAPTVGAPGIALAPGEPPRDPIARPWDLPALGGQLEQAVYGWLDEVVVWLNHSYGWQEDQIIPACWPQHPGLALDLAALAFGRLDSYQTPTAAYVGRWHADWEDFQRRMSASLGEAGRDCRRGDHTRPSTYATDSVQQAISKRMLER